MQHFRQLLPVRDLRVQAPVITPVPVRDLRRPNPNASPSGFANIVVGCMHQSLKAWAKGPSVMLDRMSITEEFPNRQSLDRYLEAELVLAKKIEDAHPEGSSTPIFGNPCTYFGSAEILGVMAVNRYLFEKGIPLDGREYQAFVKANEIRKEIVRTIYNSDISPIERRCMLNRHFVALGEAEVNISTIFFNAAEEKRKELEEDVVRGSKNIQKFVQDMDELDANLAGGCLHLLARFGGALLYNQIATRNMTIVEDDGSVLFETPADRDLPQAQLARMPMPPVREAAQINVKCKLFQQVLTRDMVLDESSAPFFETRETALTNRPVGDPGTLLPAVKQAVHQTELGLDADHNPVARSCVTV